MKKRDYYLIMIICIAAAAFGLVSWFLQREQGDQLCITVDQEVYGIYDRDEEQTIKRGTANICRIENGTVRMTEGECPDQICVQTKAISRIGQTIICMPNKVVLEIISGEKQSELEKPDDSGQQIDTIAE